MLLVIAALSLVASIQLAYHARLYLYSYDDLTCWLGPEYVADKSSALKSKQQQDQVVWKRYQVRAVHAFNLGTLLLGLGIAAALVPPDGGRQVEWRWTAAAVVLTATLVDGVWVTYLQLHATGRTDNWFYRCTQWLIGRFRRRGG
ncbi:hypothetical protein [Streptomyces sp. CRN 30]|uniref:hypothetical protein n=1 Tax=Streptomyces sp. CRN 30 TaxID=3075613 RepID=UPI002A837537|nr:hypothetical protein [Streptomyces sp. CRN 30]